MVGYTFLEGTTKCIPCSDNCFDCAGGDPYACFKCKNKPSVNVIRIGNKCFYCHTNAF